jgi:2-oxo-4-hydroxy-4-carboxy-5-ureidoimidazoline decarboxylase
MTAETQPPLTPIAMLNQLPAGEFATAVHPLFEAAGALAEPLYAGRPYASYAELIERAESIASGLQIHEQIELVNAHARIGEDAAVVRSQSSLSYREQGYDREVDVPADELQRVYATLAELNAAYEEKFGFRFVIFVNKRAKSQIVEAVRDRMRNSRATELQTALRELFAIARDRCQRLT